MDEENKPVDGLEHIAKEAADKAQYDFNPAAWAAMEKKLGGAERVPFAWWKILFPIGIVVILLLFLLWPKGSGDATLETKEDLAKHAPIEKQAEKNTEAALKSAEEGSEAINTESSENAQGAEQPKTVQSAEVQIDELAAVQKTDQNNASEPEGSNNGAFKTDKPDSPVERTASPSEQVTVGRNRFLIKKAEIHARSSKPMQFFGKPDMLVRKDSFGVEEVTDTIRQKRGGAWNFYVSTDLSVTRLDDFTKPGTMIGISRETYFGNNWSFSVGAAYSVKKYSALGRDYNTPAWALNDPEAIESILANCIVIDVPINIRKYFDTKNGNQFFVSGGVSSYFMIREDYDYVYNEPKPAWRDTWSIRNQNQHFFGILNFSAGFERPLTNKLSLGIEPFVKIPLTGIGFGEVDLLSFGLNLAIKLNK